MFQGSKIDHPVIHKCAVISDLCDSQYSSIDMDQPDLSLISPGDMEKLFILGL